MKRLDKFSLLIENEEMGKEVKRIADKAGTNECKLDFTLYFNGKNRSVATYHFRDNSFCSASNLDLKEHPLITFDQFKAMFEPKIIGYKAIDNRTRLAIMKINGLASFWDGSFMTTSLVESELNELGVLELWCEPIYEEVNTELDNLKNEAEKLKTQLESVMKAIEELDKK